MVFVSQDESNYYVRNSFRSEGFFIIAQALLTGKRQNLYQALYRELLQLAPKLSPLRVIIDFEASNINAISIHFPEARILLCLFHHRQNILKRLERLHLKG